MSVTPPKLRADLVIRPQTTEDGTHYVVKDPVTGRFYRFREVENYIARQLDGETSADVIRRRTEEHFQGSLPAETLHSFVGILKKANLLDGGVKANTRQRPGGKFLKGSLLYLRFNLLDPSRLLDRMNRRLGFLFTSKFITLSALFIAVAILIAVEDWDSFTQALPRLLDLWSIPLILLISLLTISAHEFAHGLTCRHFGGEVREMGFMLMYFQPAFYCNVSDAWLFPEKSKRLWVSFAGPYFELFLWSLAVMAWRATEPETFINFFALVVMTTSGLKTFVNFNPLLKLDGYYLLSDLLDIPNLRRKSFRYVGSLFKRLVGATVEPKERISNRERRVFLVYGLVATVLSFSVFGFAIVQMGGFLIQNNEPVPLAMFVGLAGTKLRRRVTRLFGKSRNGTNDDEDEGDTASASSSKSLKRPGVSRKRNRSARKLLRRWAYVYLGALGSIIVFFGWLELRISGPFVILPVHNADVRAEFDGIVEEIYVTEGQQVEAGQPIARLSARDFRTELAKTEAQLQQTQARLKMLELGPTRQEVELAQTAVEKARGVLKYALSRQERNTTLYRKNMLSRVEYENSQEQAGIAQSGLAEAEKKLSVLQKGARPEELEGARAEIASLEAQRSYLEETLRRVVVRSPTAGVIATPARVLEETVRQALTKGALIAKVYDFKQLMVEIAVSEKDIADVKVGSTVAFKARAFPDETFYGVVTSTATTALAGSSTSTGIISLPVLSSSGSSSTSILVTTLIDNGLLRLKPGMTGQAKISCGERKIIQLITRRIARVLKVEFWSWW